MTTKERTIGVDTVIDLAQVFPVKLYELLSNSQYEEILAWRPSGVAFEVLQPKRLVREILPTIFHQKKWTSFQRQLNIYGFKKIRRGSDMNSYFHPYFRKDHIELLDQIHRVPIKGASSYFNDFPAPASPTLPPEPELPLNEKGAVVKKPVLKRIVTISPSPEAPIISKDSLPPPLTLPECDFPSNFGSFPRQGKNPTPRNSSTNLISKYASMATPSLPVPFHYAFVPMPMAVHPFFLPPHPLSWNQFAIPPPPPFPPHSNITDHSSSSSLDHCSSSLNHSAVENSSISSNPSVLGGKTEDEEDEWSRILTELQELKEI